MITKESEWKDIWQKIRPYAVPALAVGSAFAIPPLIKEITSYGQKKMHDAMFGLLKKDSPKNIDMKKLILETKKIAGLGYIPHKTIDGFDNASYIPPGSIDSYMEKPLRDEATELMRLGGKKNKGKAEMILTSLKYNRKPGGGIIIGNKFNNIAVVAHELGHASINEKGGLKKIIQNYSKDVKKIGMWGTGIGLVTSALLEPKLGNYIFWGGLGTFGMGILGQVYTEHLATSYAKEFLGKQKLLNTRKKKLLDKALWTYIISGAGDVVTPYTQKAVLSAFVPGGKIF